MIPMRPSWPLCFLDVSGGIMFLTRGMTLSIAAVPREKERSMTERSNNQSLVLNYHKPEQLCSVPCIETIQIHGDTVTLTGLYFIKRTCLPKMKILSLFFSIIYIIFKPCWGFFNETQKRILRMIKPVRYIRVFWSHLSLKFRLLFTENLPFGVAHNSVFYIFNPQHHAHFRYTREPMPF